MATSIGDIVQRIRWAANVEISTFVTDQELATFANDDLGVLDDILVTLYEDYKLKNGQFTVSASGDGTNNFTLPTDFLKARRVERQFGSDWATLDRFSLQEHSALTHPLIIRDGYGFLGWYRIEGNVCEILPWQNSAGVYRLWYVPSFTPIAFTVDGNGKFTVSTATLPVHMDTQAWHAFVVNAGAARVLRKQDLDASAFDNQAALQKERIISAAKVRDAGRAAKVVDTRRANRFPYRRRFG